MHRGFESIFFFQTGAWEVSLIVIHSPNDPFCSLQLSALKEKLPDLAALGVVASTPHAPPAHGWRPGAARHCGIQKSAQLEPESTSPDEWAVLHARPEPASLQLLVQLLALSDMLGLGCGTSANSVAHSKKGPSTVLVQLVPHTADNRGSVGENHLHSI